MLRRRISKFDLIDAIDERKRTVDVPHRKDFNGKRINILGKNGVTVIITAPNIIVTVYRYNKAYRDSRKKEKANVRGNKGKRGRT